MAAAQTEQIDGSAFRFRGEMDNVAVFFAV